MTVRWCSRFSAHPVVPKAHDKGGAPGPPQRCPFMMGGMFRRGIIAAAAGLAVACAPALGQMQTGRTGCSISSSTRCCGSTGLWAGRIAIVHRGRAGNGVFLRRAAERNASAVDAETTYNWASITKTMTAIAILQLRDRGKLSLDDPAVRYVPSCARSTTNLGRSDAITIRDLLTHSAGFRNPTWPWDCDDGQLRLAAV